MLTLEFTESITRRVTPRAAVPRNNCTSALAVILTMFVASYSWGARQDLLFYDSHDVEVSVDGPTIAIRTTGVDPYLIWRFAGQSDDPGRVLEFEYFCTESIDPISAMLGPPWAESTRIDLPKLTIAEGWQTYATDLIAASDNRIRENSSLLRIDFGKKPDLRLQIRGVRLRPRTSKEIAEASQESERRRRKIAGSQSIAQYLNSSFRMRFDDVVIEEESVTLTGTVQDAGPDLDKWQLTEYPPHLPIHSDGIACDDAIEVTADQFRVRVPRFIESRDRIHSGWRIRSRDPANRNPMFLTARHYATSILPSGIESATRPAVPKSQKGLGGISRRGPLEELPELGIHAATINLALNSFLSPADGRGKQRIHVTGAPIYFDSREFKDYDPLIDFARRHDIVMSAVVLIHRSKHSASQSPLVHREADGGVYSMPDLSTDRGVKIYAFVLDKIAHRYRDTQAHPGGITNWIAHNEVDFQAVWTNMGQQPREVFTETYYRSMRMIHNSARAHNPHARVFASLTHHWVVPDDGKWRRLAPKEVLETLQRYSQMEGDYGWGVAYHPYPQSLFARVAWKDTAARDDPQTPLITIQNLDVLGDFLQQAEMRDTNGRTRPVLLSEQGFHSDSYSEEAQEHQAASLWYAMKKVQSLPWIESFHYHRWIDHPNEGGLMVGLRTLPTKQHKHGRRKQSWHVYQAIGTDREAELTGGLPRPNRD